MKGVALLVALAVLLVAVPASADVVAEVQSQTQQLAQQSTAADVDAAAAADHESDADEFEDSDQLFDEEEEGSEEEDALEDEDSEAEGDEFEFEDESEFDAESDVEADADAEAEAEAGVKVSTTMVVNNAVEAFLAEQNNKLKGSDIKPFWGKMPECCLASRSYDYKRGDMNYLCTVYAFWQCLPSGKMCDEQKPFKEPEPLTYTVTPTKMDPSLGSFVCYSNCKQCGKPRKNDISKTILGSLKVE